MTDRLTLGDFVRLIRREYRAIVAATVLGAGATLVGLLLLFPPLHRASANIVIVPLEEPSDLKPRSLTVEEFRRILESDSVLAATRERLVEKQVLEPDEPLRLAGGGFLNRGGSVESSIFVSEYVDSRPLAPMLEVISRSPDPESAAEVANTWVQVFMERAAELVGRATYDNVKFVEARFPKVQADLEAAERQRLEIEDRANALLDETEERWNRLVADHQRETAGELATLQTKTRRGMESFLEEQIAKVSAAAKSDRTEFESLLRRLAAVRVQLAQMTPLQSLEKELSGQALWQEADGESKIPPPRSKDDSGPRETRDSKERGDEPEVVTTLITEEPNPVYSSARLIASELETKLRNVAVGDGDVVSRFVVEIENRQHQHSTAYAQKRNARSQQLAALRRGASRDVRVILRDKETALAAIDRRIDQLRELYGTFSESLNEAFIAKGQKSTSQLQLAAPAVAQDIPEPTQRAIKTILGGILGCIAGLCLALLRDLRRKDNARTSAPAGATT